MVIWLKFVLVAGLLVAGSVAILVGFGVPIPAVTYKGFKARDLPVGVVLIVAAIALARFWKIEETTEEKQEIIEEDRGRAIRTVITKTTRYVAMRLPRRPWGDGA